MRYVAFLRALNVGGRNVIKMDRLRAVFGELPLRNVETFIASGNVIFDSTASASILEARIEKHLAARLDLSTPVMLRATGDVARAAARDPFPDKPPVTRAGLLYVGFLKDKPSRASIDRLRALADDIHDFRVDGRELYWRAEERQAVLRLSTAALDRAIGVPVTFRSISTVQKLADKYTPRAT